MKTTTTKKQTTAQQIKAAIKAAGISTKNISVKTRYPGYEESVTVEIKDVSINLEEVETIAKRFRCVDYNERCQEILQGGNTFVHVRYSYEAEAAAVAALEPLASDIVRQCEWPGDTVNINVYPGNGKAFLIVADTKGIMLIDNTAPELINRPHRYLDRSEYYPEALIRVIARRLFDLGARFVDNIPDPEPTPDPEPENSDPVYIVAAGAQSFTGYRIEAQAPDMLTAQNVVNTCRNAEITLYSTAPVYYLCTRSAVLARVDDNGFHAPKDKPQRTPSKILLMIDAWQVHKAS